MTAGLQQLPLWLNALVVLASIGVVGLGAHWAVEAAARLARRLGVSELVIGLTVVALGTSAPEFAVSIIAAFRSQGDISVGNIVGSNIFNLGFILGGCAMVRAIPIGRTLWRRDGAVLLGTSLLLFAMIATNLKLGRLEGVVLAGLLAAYLALLFRQRRQLEPEPAVDAEPRQQPLALTCGALLAGFVMIIGGSHLLIEAATVVAREFGVGEWVIGVTVVAAGTSMPELATSLVGVIKGRYALSAGNVIGSDIFNLLGVLGVAGMLNPLSVDPMARVSLAALCGMVLLLLVMMRTGWNLSRIEGLVLVAVAAARWVFDFSAHGPVP